MTLWDYLCGDLDAEERDAVSCRLCGRPLPEGEEDYGGLRLRYRSVGLCGPCMEENLPAPCSFCGNALGLNGSPLGGDPICDGCLSTYHRDRYHRWLVPYAWETPGRGDYEARMASPDAERYRLLAEAEEAAGGNRAAVHAAEASIGIP